MTKDKISKFLKRYYFIEKAIKENKSFAVFYVGKRKIEIEIDDEIKSLFYILDEIENNTSKKYEVQIIKGIKKGESDFMIMQEIAYSRSSYYIKKKELINKIYECSISKGLIKYEDIIKN